MDDETKDDEILEQQASEDQKEGHSDYKPVNRFDATRTGSWITLPM